MSKYQEVYNKMRKLIMSGSWPIGIKIPSENNLKNHYKVNRLTIRKSLEILKDEDLIKKEKGSRSVVISRKAKIIVNLTTTLNYPSLKAKRESILTKFERKKINVNRFSNESIFEIERLFCDNKKPAFIARGQILTKNNLNLTEKIFNLQKYNNASLSEILTQKYDINIYKQEIKSMAINLSEIDSKFFETPKNYPATQWVSNYYNFMGELLFIDTEISIKKIFLELYNRN